MPPINGICPVDVFYEAGDVSTQHKDYPIYTWFEYGAHTRAAKSLGQKFQPGTGNAYFAEQLQQWKDAGRPGPNNPKSQNYDDYTLLASLFDFPSPSNVYFNPSQTADTTESPPIIHTSTTTLAIDLDVTLFLEPKLVALLRQDLSAVKSSTDGLHTVHRVPRTNVF